MKKWQIAVVVVVVVVVAVGGFFGGRAAGSKTPTVQQAMQVLQNQAQQGGYGANGYGFAGANGVRRGGAVSGSIIAADSSSITVKTADGGTKIVLLSSSTTVSKIAEGTLSDLTTGQNVVVTGTTNNDGSVTATRVQVGAVSTTTAAGAGTPGDAGGPPNGGPSGSMPAGAGQQGAPSGNGGATSTTLGT